MALQATLVASLLLAAAVAMTAGCSADLSSPQEPEKKETAAMPDNAMETVLQMTLDSDRLSKYFHVEERPERKPLRILSNPAVPSAGLRLQKFGEPVVWTTAAEGADGPIFEFTAVKVEADTAVVSYRYPPEGISGTAEFHKQGSSWVETGNRVVEK